MLEKEEDKFLLDPKGNIITSPNLHLFLSSLLESNKDVNLFDINNLLNWKKEVQHILTKFKNGYSGYAKYDLDILLKYFIYRLYASLSDKFTGSPSESNFNL